MMQVRPATPWLMVVCNIWYNRSSTERFGRSQVQAGIWDNLVIITNAWDNDGASDASSDEVSLGSTPPRFYHSTTVRATTPGPTIVYGEDLVLHIVYSKREGASGSCKSPRSLRCMC